MSAMVRYLFPKSNIDVDKDIRNDIRNDISNDISNNIRNDRRQSMNPALDPFMTKSKRTYDTSKYIKIVNKAYKDILLTPDELSFLETIPRKKFNVILNINRNNRSRDKFKCTIS